MDEKFIKTLKKVFKDWKSYVIILIGTLLAAFSLNLFLIPNKIAAGGVSGLSTVLYYYTGIPVGVLTFIINIPLFILGMRYLGNTFAIRSVIATFSYALFIDLTSKVPVVTNQPILAAIYGGGLMGIGLGLVFVNKATTGGSDIIGFIINKLIPHVTVGQGMVAFDTFVIMFAAIAFGNLEYSLYAFVAMYLSTKIIDNMLEGVSFAKVAFIVSNNPDTISRAIMYGLSKGVTGLYGQGMFTRSSKKVLICVINRNMIGQLKSIVAREDPEAFMFLMDTREVLGEGFIRS